MIDILHILFPPFCQHCKKEKVWLCESCKQNLPPILLTNSPHCNTYTTAGSLQDLCRKGTGLSRIFSGYLFDSPVAKSLIHAYKFNHAKTLHNTISFLMMQWLVRQDLEQEFLAHNLLVISVPLAKKRENERGFNQAALLAKDVAQAFSLPYQELLLRVRNTLPQTKTMGPEERKNNIQGAFVFQPQNIDSSVRDKNILLVDDVYTTGATMRECARVLRKNGAKEVWGFTFAR